MSSAERGGARDAFVYCTVCGRPKKPIGRDSMDNGLCQHDCEGYRLEPTPSSYWPGERESFEQHKLKEKRI